MLDTYIYDCRSSYLCSITSKEKIEFLYNAQGKLVTRFRYLWDTNIQNWFLYYKGVYTYDTQGVFLSLIAYKWYDNEWFKFITEDWTYDFSVLFTNVIWPSSAAVNYLGTNDATPVNRTNNKMQFMPKTITSFAYQDGYRYTFFYDESIGIDSETSQIPVYPNLTSDIINIILPPHIKNAIISINDTQGRLSLQSQITDNDISVAHLPNGLYFYQIIYDQQSIQKGKLLIQH